MYKIKEAFYTLQGEGAQQGRVAVFCRFSKCNLWSGRERDRASALCTFCDTDFVGTDGQNGGIFTSAQSLANHLDALWPASQPENKFVVCTGGEPLLQLDAELISALHDLGFEIAVETNGTMSVPAGLDWVCISPKGTSQVIVNECDELKLVYPQQDAMPEAFTGIKADHYYLSPMANPLWQQGADNLKQRNTRKALQYCMQNPKWRLSIQLHKILGID